MKTKTIKEKTLTDLSTFDPMLKDVVIVDARRDRNFMGYKTKQAPTQVEIKERINRDYLGY